MNPTESLPHPYADLTSQNNHHHALSHYDYEYNKAIPCLCGVFEFNKEIV